MNILSHNLSTTHELLTSRGGLLAIENIRGLPRKLAVADE